MIEPEAYPSAAILASRRLLGANWFSADPGAVLEVLVEGAAATEALSRWPAIVRQLTTALGWPDGAVVARRVDARSGLCFCAAPRDGLMTATTLAEQAWVLGERATAVAPGAVLEALRAAYEAERAPLARAMAVVAAAGDRGLSQRVDDEQLTIGSGRGAWSWPVDAVPAADDVHWAAVTDVPTALITGSNGKTTTTRLVAALLAEAGRAVGWCCSDGAFVEAAGVRTVLEGGDMTGPAAARLVLGDRRVEAAVLETARGGLLRRGLVANRANVAVITNISLDHLGEYGVSSLEELATVKALVAHAVAHAVAPTGRLVLNADDPTLQSLVQRQQLPVAVPVVWFSGRAGHPLVEAGVAAHGHGAEVREGQLRVAQSGAWTEVGAVRALPLTAAGAAVHNVANLAAAALTATVLGVPTDVIRRRLATFGAAPTDNAGRLHRFALGGVTVVVDYAHNPDGVRALLQTVAAWPARRRLLLLGQAGNRDDRQLDALAQAATAGPRLDRVILKEMAEALRGRAHGEVPARLAAALQAAGIAGEAIGHAPDELTGVRDALAWAAPGDLLILPSHVSKAAVLTLLETLRERAWQAGHPLPA